MTKKSEKRLLCEDYCEQFKGMQDRTLAIKIYKEHKDKFGSVECARGYIREIRGHSGKKSRIRKNTSTHTNLTYNTNNKAKAEEVFAKILILDIETAPLLANIWGIWQQNVNLDNIHSDWFMLTWAGKWLFDKKVYSARVTSKEAKAQDDKRIVKSLIAILNEADIVITHNGDRFDLVRINTRAIIHKLPPPMPYISIDTLKVAKRKFAFTSNKLDYINKVLGLKAKEKTDMKLWRDCFIGEEAPLKRMEKYNINDVLIHEETYLRMRPWITPHPNVSLHIMDSDNHRCCSCGSKNLKDVGKTYNTTVNSYDMMLCENCGAYARKRKGNASVGKRQMILSSNPR